MKGAAGLLLAVGILLIPFDDSAAFAPASLNSVVSPLPHWPGHPRAGALDLLSAETGPSTMSQMRLMCACAMGAFRQLKCSPSIP